MKLMIIIIVILVECESANILGLFSHAGKSHHILGEVLFKALAEKGYNVTMASPFPLKEPFKNYRDVDIFETRKDMKDRHENNMFRNIVDRTIWNMYGARYLKDMFITQAELLFTNEELKALTKTEKFDLVIIDLFFNEAHTYYGHIFNCPVIFVASAGSSAFTNYMTGNPEPYSYVPSKYGTLSANMNLLQRFQNTYMQLGSTFVTLLEKYFQQAILDKFTTEAPKIEELLDKVALILSNSHYSFESVRPSVPNMIDVGGFHVVKPKPLPNHIQTFLDSAENGSIYFSLGSNMKSIYLGDEKIKELLNVFSRLSLKVLWKFENQSLIVSDNVLVGNWFPQNDILAHPNMKLFITHGGLLSIIESVHHGVPMIGIPIFGDQDSNVPNIVQMGSALQILRKDLSESTLYEAIMEILSNSKYSTAAKLNSRLLRDQPMKPMEKAIFWVEHVINYKGAEHLKNGSMKLAWYQYMLLDVATVTLGILIILLVFIYYSGKYLLKFVCGRKHIIETDLNKKEK